MNVRGREESIIEEKKVYNIKKKIAAYHEQVRLLRKVARCRRVGERLAAYKQRTGGDTKWTEEEFMRWLAITP